MHLHLDGSERAAILIAIWNDFQRHTHLFDGVESEFSTMMMFQSKFDLVRKLGGDPEAKLFGLIGNFRSAPAAALA